MTGQFNGSVTTSNDDDTPQIDTPHHIAHSDRDMRIDVLREYISKSPNANIKDLKKVLVGFKKAVDSEFKDLIKSANIIKYNELYPQKIQPKQKFKRGDNKGRGELFTTEEIIFFENYRNSQLKRSKIFDLYQKEFPMSKRKVQSVSDYYYYHPNPPRSINHITTGTPILQKSHSTADNKHVLTKAIHSLYKAGFTPETLPKVKPIINELLSQNCDYGEIELAIEYLKP